MGFLRRMAGMLGLVHGEDGGDVAEEEDREGVGEDKRRADSSAAASANRRGFSVQVPVPVERPQVGPVFVPCDVGEGGVQGFKWHGRRLRIDEDGDVADEFFDEVLPVGPSAATENPRPPPTFRVKHATRRAVVRSQMVSADGTVRHGVELRGQLLWV
ncbi:unnamed protein product [Spirodela intermedia]|uniref:Uncharacterized protein n=1 Tax=Spirodela intermedia TaxID=51605 RepID=A0A7I8K6J9_SPIIN|nr:unnamed protein product [Spirodela intermedia]